MKILHICSYFCGSKVHSNLYKELDRLGLYQTVFTCYRRGCPAGTNQYEGPHSDFVYRGVLSTKHRFFFHAKIKKMYKELICAVNPNEFNLAHAVTMFSDGAVAYKLYQNYGIPYVVTVRNTDINEFMYLAPHTWRIGLNVLRYSKKIVFISKSPMEKFCSHFLIKRMLPDIKNKMIVQPNGVDNYWLNHISTGEPRMNHDIIYVGKFDWNKNVVRLIDAVLSLRDEIPDLRLHLVGGDGAHENKVKAMITANNECLVYHGKIYDKDKLKELYGQCSIFAMASIHETFGLVYIEAMTQNLALLYTKNQGIDGLFNDKIGEAVNAMSEESIKNGLRKLLLNRKHYAIQESVDFEQFRWEGIAHKYKSIYESI